jgi:DNA-binding NtrC family response regulator
MDIRSTSSPSSLPSGRDVLVVEDEVRIRNMLSQALNEMGFRATLTPSAEAASKALQQRVYDILILDLNLPGVDGIEFLKSVRRQNGDIQVIILTGFGDLEAAKMAIHLDVVEFLTKPCALGTLEMALDRAGRRRKGRIVDGSGDAGARPHLQFDTAPAARSEARMEDPPAKADDGLEELERRHILRVLQKQNGNRAATAAELGISLRKLYYRLGEYQKKGLIP